MEKRINQPVYQKLNEVVRQKKFLKSKGYSKTPKGYEVDHIIPLSKGGQRCSFKHAVITERSSQAENS